MRVYRLHDRAWTRIVTHRVRRPNVIGARLRSRRRREHPIPIDGQLVLLDGDQAADPRSGDPVDRRELLDRLIEALSVPEVDGVVGSPDLLEELTVLNVLEHRLAICRSLDGVAPGTIEASGFDAAEVRVDATRAGQAVARVGALHGHGVPVLADLRFSSADAASDVELDVQEWSAPLRTVVSSVTTGPGVWLALPAFAGLDQLAELVGFPILVRDTEVPIDSREWTAWFGPELPLTVRGMVAGPSALFPLHGSVFDATTRMATPCDLGPPERFQGRRVSQPLRRARAAALRSSR